MGAVLAIPFTANFIKIEQGLLSLRVINDLLVMALSIFGRFLCLDSWVVIGEFRRHVENLWDGADHLISFGADAFPAKLQSKAYLILRLGVLVFTMAWITILVNAIW